MRMKFLTLFAAVLLLGACETASDEQAATDSGGSATSSSSSSDTVSSTAIPGPTPGSQEDLTVNVGDRVFFDFDRSELRPDARETVDRLAVWLGANPSVTLTIEGHADERGTTEYNLALGARRAASAHDYLIALGVSANRLSTISYGEERPAVSGQGEWAWSQNRRDVFVVN